MPAVDPLLQEQPDNLEVLRLLAENCDALGAMMLNKVADVYPDTPAGLEVHAQALEFEGSYSAALQVYRELQQLEPDRAGIKEAIERLNTTSSTPRPPSPSAVGDVVPSRP